MPSVTIVISLEGYILFEEHVHRPYQLQITRLSEDLVQNDLLLLRFLILEDSGSFQVRLS